MVNACFGGIEPHSASSETPCIPTLSFQVQRGTYVLALLGVKEENPKSVEVLNRKCRRQVELGINLPFHFLIAFSPRDASHTYITVRLKNGPYAFAELRLENLVRAAESRAD